MLFSRRTPADLSENPLARALRRRQTPPVDLTVSNPTSAGLAPSDDELRAVIAPAGSGSYHPHPRGIASAREAVSGWYATRGREIPAERIVLTASTSEAYALLFKLLGDPGDVLLAPEPSYPLFDHLVRLEGLSVVPYRLRASPVDGRWRIDLATVERGLDEGARAILAVHPHNPTGSFLKEEERRAITALLEPSRHAIVSDEVFLDFAVENAAGKAGAAAEAREGPLAFSLGGLSKSCALPQMKLAWIAVGGDRRTAEDALERLEIIADTYLSVATPVQLALPAIFEIGARAAERVRARLRRNLAALDDALGRIRGAGRFPVEGGWSAVVRLPIRPAGGDPALMLLETADVLVQPGWFFDFEAEDVAVVSLLPEPAAFDEGLRRIVSVLG